MPGYGAQSAHNKNAFDFLATRSPEYLDWQITALFYAALHSLNQHFELLGVKVPASHSKRSRLVKRRLPSIWRPYKNLQALSERSRYVGRGGVDDASEESALRSYAEIMDGLLRAARASHVASRRLRGRPD